MPGCVKVGIAGTHSTGKTSFLSELQSRLQGRGLNVGRLGDMAKRARALGFPILTEHTFESTLWVMAECMRQEAEASLTLDVILVDRPVLDALAYLNAALEVSHRTLPASKLMQLWKIAHAHTCDYDIHIATVLDRTLPIAEGRDDNDLYRATVDRHVGSLIRKFRPDTLLLVPSERLAIADHVVSLICETISARSPTSRELDVRDVVQREI